MRPTRALLLALLSPGLALAAWIVAGLLMVRLATRGGIMLAPGAVEPAVAVLVGWWLAGVALGAWVVRALWRSHVLGAARLLNATRIMAADPAAARLGETGELPRILGLLAAEFEALAADRGRLRADMARMVDEASRNVAEQRDQLAALMAELDHAVVVCNLEGRILLYNARARELARRLAPAAAGVGGTGLGVIGLGRSIQAMLDPAAVAHALETVEGRIARGVDASAAVAQFVTTSEAGHLLRVSLAPVRPAEEAQAGAGLTGYVLLIDDITLDQQVQTRRDRALLKMTEESRASVAAMQAALEMLDYPDLDQADRDRFLEVVRDEVAAMRDRLAVLNDSAAQDLATRWPLNDMLGSDLIAAAVRRLGKTTGTPIATAPVDDELWLRIDSFGLIQALDFLASRIRALQLDPALWLRLSRVGNRAHLDLGWAGREGGPAINQGQLIGLQSEAMGEGAPSVRDVVERHGGEIWLDRNRDDGRPFFRMLLPVAAVDIAAPSSPIGSRPEFYDFDLFGAGHDSADDDRPLAEMTFTVFDCEMTGLDPSGGDEIIQIGAVRIVNARILTGETIDQLVDPQRSIPEAGIPIHHIHPHMVRGKPTIGQALPVFHRFAQGSVLVGHNVAFDLRFLKLKETATGCVFDHPVLDTLLLSSVVHPAEESHSLDAVAERLGITIGGRHTALGDALATAEVFAKLIPLLGRQGIRTLGQAREASARSQFARLRY